MLNILAGALLVTSLILGVIPLVLTRRFQQQLASLMREPQRQPHGRVAAIIPCKGVDQGFRDNIRAFLTQQYSDLDLIFVVATADDPARAHLAELIAEHQRSGNRNVRASLHVAGIDNRRAQKLTNQLHGLTHAADTTEYLVFLDSDIRPDAGFIQRLIAPLDAPGVGATTGFRWYHPPRPTLGSMLRSTWNAGALPLLTNPATVFAFGGAMAMRRTLFEKAGIGQAWETALSDDFPFTRGAKSLGLEIRFVPTCVAVSYETSTLAETLEFTNRQSIISRVYFPPLWWGAAIAHSLSVLLVIAGMFGIALWALVGGTASSIASACLVIIPLQCVNAALLLKTVPTVLPQLSGDIERLRWRYLACAPLATLLSLINTLYSVTTRQIVWRGIRYELVSPTVTRVLSERHD